MSEAIKEFVVSLLDGTPSSAFVPGRKIITTIGRDGSAWIEFEPGVRSTRPRDVGPNSQESQSRMTQPLESFGR